MPRMDFLSGFLGSSARAKALRLFVFNAEGVFTSAEVGQRAQLTRAAAQKEVNFLKRLGIIKQARSKSGQPNRYQLDTDNAHLPALTAFLRDVSGIDHGEFTARLRGAGKLKLVIASGSFVDDSASRVDLLVVADALNERKLQTALRGIEADLGRELRYAAFLTDEFTYRLTVYDKLIRDILDYPHRVYLDRLGVTKQ